MPKISKDLVTKIMKLTVSHSWLGKKASSVAETLEECDTEQQQELLLDMLGRFSYVSEDQYTSGLKEMVRCLFEDGGLIPSKTQLYGLQMSRDTDSSNEVAYRVRGIVEREVGSGLKTFSTMNRVPELSIEERPFVVIVDEFVGSGRTAKNAIEHLFRRSQGMGIELDPNNVYLCFLAGMDFAIKQLKDEFPINFFCHMELRKGIAGFYEGDTKDRAYEDMKALEGRLCDPCPVSDESLPRLGYGAAEALYYREEGNPPNSNFPVFWWGYRKDTGNRHMKREPLLRRAI